MKPVSRAGLTVKPTKRFLNWVRELDDSNAKVSLDDLHANQTVYLIPAYESEQAAVEYLWDYCKVVFTHQLKRWTDDPKQYPKDLSWNVFMEWFDIELQPKVVDIEEDAKASSPFA